MVNVNTLSQNFCELYLYSIKIINKKTIDMKQGKEEFKIVKDPENVEQRNYIFQKNKKTTAAFYFVAIVLIALIAAIAVTAFTL